MPPPMKKTPRTEGEGRGRTAAVGTASAAGSSRPFDRQPGPEVHHPTKASHPYKRSQAAPDVLWADDGKSLDDYTFYRESTPPPPTTRASPEDSKKGKTRAGAGGGGKGPFAGPTICGLRRRLFCIALFAAIVVVGLGVGLGLGLTVGSKSKSEENDSLSPITSGATSRASSPSSTPTPTASPTSSATSSTVSTSSASPESTPIISCPAANDTEYSVPHSQKTFLRICGVDYSGVNQAVDLGNVLTDSMQDCMINCAGYPGCTGCGWGIIPGDAGAEHRCWLKGNLQEHHMTRSGWEFAILQ